MYVARIEISSLASPFLFCMTSFTSPSLLSAQPAEVSSACGCLQNCLPRSSPELLSPAVAASFRCMHPVKTSLAICPSGTPCSFLRFLRSVCLQRDALVHTARNCTGISLYICTTSQFLSSCAARKARILGFRGRRFSSRRSVGAVIHEAPSAPYPQYTPSRDSLLLC